jgi:hypothetical protein
MRARSTQCNIAHWRDFHTQRNVRKHSTLEQGVTSHRSLARHGQLQQDTCGLARRSATSLTGVAIHRSLARFPDATKCKKLQHIVATCNFASLIGETWSTAERKVLVRSTQCNIAHWRDRKNICFVIDRSLAGLLDADNCKKLWHIVATCGFASLIGETL